MSNPIDNGPRPPGSYPTSSKTGAARTDSRGEGENRMASVSAPTQDDSTSESNRLQAVREAIDNTPEVDSNRVQDLRERISRGEYPLDANRIAERFADFEQLLSDG